MPAWLGASHIRYDADEDPRHGVMPTMTVRDADDITLEGPVLPEVAPDRPPREEHFVPVDALRRVPRDPR
jgi:hypothetical protein